MSKVIITGATGNAGSAALTAAIASPGISHIAVIARRRPFDESPKIKHIQLPSEKYPKGFEEIPASVVDELKREGYDSCIWALGITQTQVSKDEYIKITHDYTIQAAQAFSTLGTTSRPFKFIFMSGEGARQDEKGYALFSKIKGRTEKELYAMKNGSFDVVNIRPGGIIPTSEHRQRMNWWMAQSFRSIGALLGTVYPSAVIESLDLGRTCVGLAEGKGWEKRDAEGVITNPALRQMAQDWAGDYTI
ncbi:hypothetical protein I302_109047 [Kwoniella bestiolae CBS 10118]|uniref:NAD(P)-binding domain-containing protein n=1 Tax=Kwoniella bestiolae CBS 10118 TaxID=1296100 RepID=A0A1B9FUU9_9TREE|nr:hypothetical protein I302_08191 [Kwoniella bestiolae CBS 10118]OCF22541.1 hypothetical protein I302_08191 [Kwoniella bestiolae CBS 10118]